jgi:hypothetical protein
LTFKVLQWLKWSTNVFREKGAIENTSDKLFEWAVMSINLDQFGGLAIVAMRRILKIFSENLRLFKVI